MNDTEIFLVALRGLQASLRSAADQIEVILEMAARPSPSTNEKETCPHPMAARVSTGAMGHLTRFFCKVCKQEVEE